MDRGAVTRYLVINTHQNPYSRYGREALFEGETWEQAQGDKGPWVRILRDGEAVNGYNGTAVSEHATSEESLRKMEELRKADDVLGQ